MQRLLDHLKELDRQVDELEPQIQKRDRNSDVNTKIAHMRGIGTVDAITRVGCIGDAMNFALGRHFYPC